MMTHFAIRGLMHEAARRFFNDPATTEIYPLSLHDALPICKSQSSTEGAVMSDRPFLMSRLSAALDRKSTRLNSSHLGISYSALLLQKKKLREPLKPRAPLAQLGGATHPRRLAP